MASPKWPTFSGRQSAPRAMSWHRIQQYFLGMNRAHRITVGLRRVDLVRVDQLIALLIFVQVELHVWHVTSGPARIWSTLAALIFSVPVALRRRWPLPGMLVIIGA